MALLFLIAMVLIPPLSAEKSASDSEWGDRFTRGMTVSFPGTQCLQIRLHSEPLPDLGQGGPVKRLKLGPPLDLWLLGMDGNRTACDGSYPITEQKVPARDPDRDIQTQMLQGAALFNPRGDRVEAEQAGHWRVDRPKHGYYSLIVPPTGGRWRLWSAFHPFMVRVPESITVIVGDEPGAAFLYPSGTKVELTEPGEVVIGDDEEANWVAFQPWDLFEPSRPNVRIKGDAAVGPDRRLKLKAVTSDPDDDLRRIRWQLPDGETAHGATLDIQAPWMEAWKAKVTVEDADGATASAQVQVMPPPLHEAEIPDMIIIQAEDFSAEGRGKVYVTDRGSNVARMITKWHKDEGHWIEWTFSVEEAGQYVLYARYATGSKKTRRNLTIDGELPDREYSKIAFAHTGGYGRSPGQWRPKKLGPPVRLSAGEHRLRMKNLGQGLALDYIAMVPLREGQ